MDWQPIKTAVSDGTRARVRWRDALGYYTAPFDCFLYDDGKWYRIDPPLQLGGTITHWMPAPPSAAPLNPPHEAGSAPMNCYTSPTNKRETNG